MTDAHNCYPYEGRWNNRIKRSKGAIRRQFSLNSE